MNYWSKLQAIRRRLTAAIRKHTTYLVSDKSRLKKVCWASWAVATLLVTVLAYSGAFMQPNVQSLPIVSNDETPAMTRIGFLKKIQATPDAYEEVQMFPPLTKILIRPEGSPRGYIIVDFETDPIKDLKPILDEKKIAYSIKAPRNQDWMARQSAWFISLMIAVVGGGIALIVWTCIPKDSNPNYGLGLAGAIGGSGTTSAADDPRLEKVTFIDVAGADEAIVHLQRIQRKLKYRVWYTVCGAPIPKGFLFVGPPGTGKTLLARALAGEVDGGFWPCSGSDFVEMYVGVGASRVRDKINKAKEAYRKTGKLQFIFIDEIDAVGMERSTRGTGGDSERNQTLNQILVAMDGFDVNDGVVFLAATNLESSLDKALTRPGRFEHKIVVDNPDIDGREKIFGVHTRKMQLAHDIELRSLAIRCPDFSGSHIAMVCREAATYSAERGEHLCEGLTDEEIKALPREVTLKDFDRAIDYVQFGDELLSRMRNQTEEDKKNISVHEAGHAVVATACGGDPVTKVTRSMRSKSLGMMQAHAESDRYGMKEDQIKTRIKIAFGGRAAQEVILKYKDTGASSDFEQGNRLARLMVAAFGMSPLGPISIPVDKNGFPTVPLGPRLASQFDTAWVKIANELYAETLVVVRENIERINRVTDAVMENETILAKAYMRAYNGEPEPNDEESSQAATASSVPDATGYSL